MEEKVIGVDESGKGDYFGPLVIAGVYLNKDTEKRLSALGVKDSKNISDKKVLEISNELKKIVKYSVVVVNPERYNELYSRIKNLNKLLAWGHCRVIENLLKEVECEHVISDKFGNERYILNALMEKGKKILVKQETQAERYLPVAAASVVARAEFLKRLAYLSEEVKEELPKGATNVIETAKKLVGKYGQEILLKVAKVHFKITKKINYE